MKKVRTVKSSFRFPKSTPKEQEEYRLKLKKEAEEIPDDFKIGVLIGKLCWATTMPTLSTDIIKSGHVIKVDELDDVVITANNADDELSKHIWRSDYEEFKKTQEWKDLWNNYLKTKNEVEVKYLPPTFEFWVGVRINDTPMFWKGLEHALWDTDGCSYHANKDSIKMRYNMEFTTVFTFQLDSSINLI